MRLQQAGSLPSGDLQCADGNHIGLPPRRSLVCPIGVLVVLMMQSAQARTPPSAGDIQRQIERQMTAPEVAPPPVPAAPAAPLDDSGPKVTIERIRIEGASLIPADALARHLDDIIGTPLSLGRIQAAVQSLAGVYREHGWFARVELPAQDLSDGTLRIRIVEGRFGEIRPRPGETRANAAFVAGIVGRHLDAGQPYSLADLERGLLLANDLPGIRADGTLRAGDLPGTSDLALTVADGPLLGGYLGASNFGNRFTGRAQGRAGLTLDDLSGYGDRLTLDALGADRLGHGAIDYELPLGHDGLRARLGYNRIDYSLGKSFAALDSEGRSETVRAGLAYPLIRGSAPNLRLALDVVHRHQQDESLGLTLRRRALDIVTLALQGDARDGWGGGGANLARLTLNGGQADLRDAFDRAQDHGSAGVDGDFAYLGLDAQRDQLLTASLYLRARLSAQLAFVNLDASQQFGLGGPYGVRGYPINEGSGDSGALLQLELHSLLPWSGIPGLDGYLFLDSGVIRQHHDTWDGRDTADTGHNRYSLHTAGLGLGWTHRSGFTLSGTLGLPFGANHGSGDDRNQDGSRRGPLAWVTLNQRF